MGLLPSTAAGFGCPGNDHPDVLQTRNNLAVWYSMTGRNDDAIAELEGLVADKRRVLGDDHPDTLTTLDNLTYALGRKPFVKDEKESIGRNSPCYCGSGRKFKRCHGKR